MVLRWSLVAVVLLLGAWPVGAQQILERCKHTTVSRAATPDGTDITVGAVAVVVLSPDTSLCSAIVTNLSQTNSIRCRADADPDGNTGFLVLPYQVLSLSNDAQLGLKCIRATGMGDSMVTVLEYRE